MKDEDSFRHNSFVPKTGIDDGDCMAVMPVLVIAENLTKAKLQAGI